MPFSPGMRVGDIRGRVGLNESHRQDRTIPLVVRGWAHKRFLVTAIILGTPEFDISSAGEVKGHISLFPRINFGLDAMLQHARPARTTGVVASMLSNSHVAIAVTIREQVPHLARRFFRSVAE